MLRHAANMVDDSRYSLYILLLFLFLRSYDRGINLLGKVKFAEHVLTGHKVTIKEPQSAHN